MGHLPLRLEMVPKQNHPRFLHWKSIKLIYTWEMELRIVLVDPLQSMVWATQTQKWQQSQEDTQWLLTHSSKVILLSQLQEVWRIDRSKQELQCPTFKIERCLICPNWLHHSSFSLRSTETLALTYRKLSNNIYRMLMLRIRTNLISSVLSISESWRTIKLRHLRNLCLISRCLTFTCNEKILKHYRLWNRNTLTNASYSAMWMS